MSLRYDNQFSEWLEWIAKQISRPEETDMVGFCRLTGQPRDGIDDMAKDVWGILVIRLTGETEHVLEHADRQGGTPATKVGGIVFELMRDSQGQLSTRRMAATELVTKPVAARNWADVPARVGQWETNLLDFEVISGRALDPLVKTEAFLRLLPTSLKELALNQRGLENNFAELTQYIIISCKTLSTQQVLD